VIENGNAGSRCFSTLGVDQARTVVDPFAITTNSCALAEPLFPRQKFQHGPAKLGREVPPKAKTDAPESWPLVVVNIALDQPYCGPEQTGFRLPVELSTLR